MMMIHFESEPQHNFISPTESGCPTISTPDNGKITYLNAKASAMLFCEPNYETVGSSYAHCNGTHWDRVVGSCRETDNTPATFCDFESELNNFDLNENIFID